MAARGIARFEFAELAALRKTPPSRFVGNLGPLTLKHSDEQTVAALVAIDRAMSAANITNESCRRWAIVSTSSYLGRNASIAVTDRFQAEGPWGVSVHPTPHRSLHSVASTVSLGLQNHGPSIGAGGARARNPVVLSAAGLLQSGHWDGVWVLFQRLVAGTRTRHQGAARQFVRLPGRRLGARVAAGSNKRRPRASIRWVSKLPCRKRKSSLPRRKV